MKLANACINYVMKIDGFKCLYHCVDENGFVETGFPMEILRKYDNGLSYDHGN